MVEATFTYPGVLELERGGRLRSPSIAYRVWGSPKSDGSNVVWVCHALTANSDVYDWWPGFFGSDHFFNERDWCIVCANVIGSCYGSTGPLSINPDNGQPYFNDFHELTIRDLVGAHRLLAAELGIDRIAVLIGGSLGGQQALEWAVQEPERIEHLIVMATNAVHSPWGVAFNETQRMAIESDATWGTSAEEAGAEGLKTARAIALLSYRHYDAYDITQKPKPDAEAYQQPAVTYQRYQGLKLALRFNAYSYHLLTRIMDSHDLGRGRGSIEHALGLVKARTLVLAISNDVLFPPTEQIRIANGIPHATYTCIDSLYGHDGFLVESGRIAHIVATFLQTRGAPIADSETKHYK